MRVPDHLDVAPWGYSDRANWPSIQEYMVDAMVRLEKALRPYVKASALPRQHEVQLTAASAV
jgi:hypothetical protein